MIYRVVGESSEWVWSEESGAMEISLSPGRLMGAFNAGVADGALGRLAYAYAVQPPSASAVPGHPRSSPLIPPCLVSRGSASLPVPGRTR